MSLACCTRTCYRKLLASIRTKPQPLSSRTRELTSKSARYARCHEPNNASCGLHVSMRRAMARPDRHKGCTNTVRAEPSLPFSWAASSPWHIRPTVYPYRTALVMRLNMRWKRHPKIILIITCDLEIRRRVVFVCLLHSSKSPNVEVPA